LSRRGWQTGQLRHSLHVEFVDGFGVAIDLRERQFFADRRYRG
jgi:hypothetical protein